METVVHVLIFIVCSALAWGAQGLIKTLLAPSRARGRARLQARRHFVSGAQLLARSRAAKTASAARSLAREASDEAEKAIAFDSRDAASHVLKALALEQQGSLSAALRSMDTALSPSIVRTLSDSEKADAYMKRGGLGIATSKGKRGLGTAVEDLQKSLELNPRNPKVLCMLGLCFERKSMFADAQKSYEKAFALDQSCDDARAGLMRLRP